STKLIRGLTSEAPAGFQSRRGLSYDDSAPVSPHNAPFPTYKAISPICDRCRSTFNFALNGGRFALPVDGPHTTKEQRHETTHRMRDRRCVTRRKRWPDDRKRATGRGTRFHCGRPPSDRRAGVGEIANRRMVERRHLPQRQVYRSDWLREWGGQQNGSRLANGSPSRRQPMTTTTIEPDGAPVLLAESARAGERRRLKPSPLDRARTAAAEISQSRSILSGSKAPIAPLRVVAAAHLASPATHLPAILESAVCKGGNERVKRAPPHGLSAT